MALPSVTPQELQVLGAIQVAACQLCVWAVGVVGAVVGAVVGFVATDVVAEEAGELVDFVDIMFSVELVSCAAALSILFPHADRDKHSASVRTRVNVLSITMPPLKIDYLQWD